MKRTSVILSILTLVTVGSVYSQAHRDTTEYLLPRMVLKFAPLSLIDYFPAVQFGLEYKVSDYFHLQHDLGYILPASRWIEDADRQQSNAISLQNEDYVNYPYVDGGIRFRTEARFYWPPREFRSQGGYFATELFYIQAHYSPKNTFGYDCIDASCIYFRYLKYDIIRRIAGLNIKIGAQRSFNRLVIDYYGGLGIRVNLINLYNFPDEAVLFNVRNYPDEGVVPALGLSLGVKLGYVLK